MCKFGRLMLFRFRRIFVRWRLTVSITTDDGLQFPSHAFEQWLSERGIRQVTTPLYRLQGHSGVERFNQVNKQGLSAQLAAGTSITEALRIVLFNCRVAAHSVTGKSPAELMDATETAFIAATAAVLGRGAEYRGVSGTSTGSGPGCGAVSAADEAV